MKSLPPIATIFLVVLALVCCTACTASPPTQAPTNARTVRGYKTE